MIYMDTKGKIHWELFITVLLVFVCIMIPMRLALNLDTHELDCNGKEDPYAFTPWERFFYACDLLFLCDLVA
jgi:hypothetical protein